MKHRRLRAVTSAEAAREDSGVPPWELRKCPPPARPIAGMLQLHSTCLCTTLGRPEGNQIKTRMGGGGVEAL